MPSLGFVSYFLVQMVQLNSNDCRTVTLHFGTWPSEAMATAIDSNGNSY